MVTSAARVGLPRLSRSSRAWTLAMVVMSGSLQFSGLGFEEAVALGDLVDCHQRFQQCAHLTQRPGVGAVGQRLLRLRMGFHEDAGNAEIGRASCRERVCQYV